jgi:hypothetical protein
MPVVMTATVQDIQSQTNIDVLQQGYLKRPGVRKKERRLINRQIARLKKSEQEAMDKMAAEDAERHG